jgi:hypothetical protein
LVSAEAVHVSTLDCSVTIALAFVHFHTIV